MWRMSGAPARATFASSRRGNGRGSARARHDDRHAARRERRLERGFVFVGEGAHGNGHVRPAECADDGVALGIAGTDGRRADAHDVEKTAHGHPKSLRVRSRIRSA